MESKSTLRREFTSMFVTLKILGGYFEHHRTTKEIIFALYSSASLMLLSSYFYHQICAFWMIPNATEMVNIIQSVNFLLAYISSLVPHALMIYNCYSGSIDNLFEMWESLRYKWTVQTVVEVQKRCVLRW